ncbi:MAG TPA: DUF1236 domain-containing protein [Rhizomicrobium sp.]|jgi:hypothetical protein|nr:DUF1236 domain-containing protein [Rhizomicrobium sp.]
MKLPILALATAALLCGTSVVSAQESPNGGAPASDQNRNQRERPSDQTKQPGAGQEAEPRNGSEEMQRGNAPSRDMERTEPQGGQMLRGGEMRERGGIRNLTVEQKTNLRETVLRRGPRVTNINFRIGVGAVVPRSVRLVAVPQPIIAIYPEWSGDLYFDYGDEIVVVAPDTLQIVGVLPV